MRLRLKAAGHAKGNRSSLGIWFQAVRFHFVPPSFIPAVLCSVIAWLPFQTFDFVAFLLVLAGVTVHHFGLNMLDDVFDYLHFVDQSDPAEKNPYTGGSGVLTEGLLTVREMLMASVVCFLVTAAIGFFLAWLKGWPILVFGFIGMFSSIFYTAPPIRFGYRGFGELMMIVNFGPVIGLGSYYVQCGRLDLEPFLVSLVLGFLMWSMLIINEIPDYEDDRRGGKLNLVARFGRRTGVVLYVAGLVAAYGILLTAVLMKVAPTLALLGFLSLPLAFKSIRILTEHYLDRLKMTPANLMMIKVYVLTGLSLVTGYILDVVF
jgi:1,4-dihydroxy-2-naphthoate octaprenyltransferase